MGFSDLYKWPIGLPIPGRARCSGLTNAWTGNQALKFILSYCGLCQMQSKQLLSVGRRPGDRSGTGR